MTTVGRNGNVSIHVRVPHYIYRILKSQADMFGVPISTEARTTIIRALDPDSPRVRNASHTKPVK